MDVAMAVAIAAAAGALGAWFEAARANSKSDRTEARMAKLEAARRWDLTVREGRDRLEVVLTNNGPDTARGVEFSSNDLLGWAIKFPTLVRNIKPGAEMVLELRDDPCGTAPDAMWLSWVDDAGRHETFVPTGAWRARQASLKDARSARPYGRELGSSDETS